MVYCRCFEFALYLWNPGRGRSRGTDIPFRLGERFSAVRRIPTDRAARFWRGCAARGGALPGHGTTAGGIFVKTEHAKTRRLVEVALFSAIVVVLATVPFLGYIPLGFINATTIHIPVILASVLLGPKEGAMVGGVFGLTSLVKNTVQPNLTSFVFTPFYAVGDVSGNFWSLVICLAPRILVGVVPYFVYRLVKKVAGRSEVLPLAAAGISGALTNTLLVMNLIYLFFAEPYGAANAGKIAELGSGVYGFILATIVTSGIPEALAAAVLVAALGKVLLAVRRRMQ